MIWPVLNNNCSCSPQVVAHSKLTLTYWVEMVWAQNVTTQNSYARGMWVLRLIRTPVVTPPPPHSYKVTLFTTRLPNQSCNAISGALSQQCQAILASLHTYVYWDIQAANYFHKVPALSSLLGVIYIHNTSTIIVQWGSTGECLKVLWLYTNLHLCVGSELAKSDVAHVNWFIMMSLWWQQTRAVY